MSHFCVSDRLKAIKKTSSGLIGSLNINKKVEICLRALFFIKFSAFFFAFLSQLETSHFSYQDSVNDKPPLQSKEAHWTKNSFSRNCSCFFFASTLSFRDFKRNFLISFWGFTTFLESHGMDSLTNCASSFVLRYKWKYLVLWVDGYCLLRL